MFEEEIGLSYILSLLFVKYSHHCRLKEKEVIKTFFDQFMISAISDIFFVGLISCRNSLKFFVIPITSH